MFIFLTQVFEKRRNRVVVKQQFILILIYQYHIQYLGQVVSMGSNCAPERRLKKGTVGNSEPDPKMIFDKNVIRSTTSSLPDDGQGRQSPALDHKKKGATSRQKLSDEILEKVENSPQPSVKINPYDLPRESLVFVEVPQQNQNPNKNIQIYRYMNQSNVKIPLQDNTSKLTEKISRKMEQSLKMSKKSSEVLLNQQSCLGVNQPDQKDQILISGNPYSKKNIAHMNIPRIRKYDKCQSGSSFEQIEDVQQNAQ